MASRLSHTFVAAALAGSLIIGSTEAVAATAQPAPQPDSWAVLAVMSGGAPAATICGAAAVAAQGVASPGGCVLPVADAVPVPVQAAPPPPLPPEALVTPGAGIGPLALALIAIAAGVGILLAIHHNGSANSPA